VFPNGSLTASTKANAQVHWKFVNLRRLSEMSGRTLMLNARGTGGAVSRMDIQTWASNYWLQWQVQNVTSWSRSWGLILMKWNMPCRSFASRIKSRTGMKQDFVHGQWKPRRRHLFIQWGVE
jgi:hypothetical protein